MSTWPVAMVVRVAIVATSASINAGDARGELLAPLGWSTGAIWTFERR